MGHQQEKATAPGARLKETKKELEEAKRYIVDFAQTMAWKDSNLEQRDAELKKKEQLLALTTARFKDKLKEASVEAEELRVELEKTMRNFRLKEDEPFAFNVEYWKLFVWQFEDGANSALLAIKAKFSDLHYSLLDQSPAQESAPLALSFKVPDSGHPAFEDSGLPLLDPPFAGSVHQVSDSGLMIPPPSTS